MRTPLISLVTTIAVTLALGACGQKGPLYLPQDPATPAATGTGTGTSSAHSQPATPTAREADKHNKSEQQTQQHTEAEAVAK